MQAGAVEGLCKATDVTQWALGAVGLVAGGCIESSDAGGLNWMASPLAHAIVMSRCSGGHAKGFMQPIACPRESTAS
jgi:hypothetical protein